MEKKIKSLDLSCLLITMLFLASIALLVLFFIFMNSDELQEVIKGVLLFVGAGFLGLASICNIIVSVIGMKVTTDDENLNKNVKLLFGLNFVPLFLAIPANIIIRKLVKKYLVNHEQGIDLNMGVPLEVLNANNAAMYGVDQTQQIAQDYTGYEQYGYDQQGMMMDQGVQQQQGSYPINEAFFYDNKWMLFDGYQYYETDENNQWIPSSTVPY